MSQVERPHMLQIYIYVRDEEKPYYLAGPKLYRMMEDPGGSFVNCGQDELAESAEELGHVIARARLTREEQFWPTWNAFADEVGLSAL
jgi:hypothetical protein